MKAIKAMVENLPHSNPSFSGQLAAALVALAECEQVCRVCADSCLEEDDVRELRHCVREDLTCAAACQATAQILSRPSDLASPVIQAMLHACIAACQSCADVCGHHEHEHCRICRDTCLHCQETCNLLLGAINPTSVGSVWAPP
ncbi:MAG TPA: four-helix bundle copper-binding protein [Candidatus Didemnitutus sp.]|nr:four-helix bundle copper-binding protein [Candidatus Didemnitutus sp.]